MSVTPVEHAEGLHIGVVDFVSPDEVKVSLDIEAPESIALNAGGPRPFPRVNGYVMIPVDEGYVVGQIGWITVERSPFPIRRGMQDFGLVDLPYPLRKMSLIPMGTLRKSGASEYTFKRGAEVLPSIGAAVLLPTQVQLRSIIESGQGRRVKIGTSPLAGNAEVCIDPDRLFGRHLAVLGNTGSGKSCTVAGLIRWSLECAQRSGEARPNARFVILDPNGEYSRAFGTGQGTTSARVFTVSPNVELSEAPLRVPMWFWNSTEWCSFTQASARAQRPLIRRALREVKAGRSIAAEPSDAEGKLRLRRFLSSTMISVRQAVRSGAIKDDSSKLGFLLRAVAQDLVPRTAEFPNHKLDEVQAAIQSTLKDAYASFTEKGTGKFVEYYHAFNEAQMNGIIQCLGASLDTLGGLVYEDGPDEDVPVPFSGTDLADHLEILGGQEGVSQYIDFLIARIRTFLSDARAQSVVGDVDGVTLESWLTDYIGGESPTSPCITIIDLSLVPTEVVQIVTAVTARMVFEALQRYRKLNAAALPTVLVMEEAHTFIRRYREDSESLVEAVCCQVFERIAREGRKFGLGLVLSSQRPSELSPTVLSQCNSFMLHRISNDRDQELVQRLVPDNLRGLLRELPSLPSQTAILLGWASELPVLVRVSDLPKANQPRSDDPDFWGVWTGRGDDGAPVTRSADWKAVVMDWQKAAKSDQEPDQEPQAPHDDPSKL